MDGSLYDIPLQRIDGAPTTLGAYRGKVLLIVNRRSAERDQPRLRRFRAEPDKVS